MLREGNDVVTAGAWAERRSPAGRHAASRRRRAALADHLGEGAAEPVNEHGVAVACVVRQLGEPLMHELELLFCGFFVGAESLPAPGGGIPTERERTSVIFR